MTSKQAKALGQFLSSSQDDDFFWKAGTTYSVVIEDKSYQFTLSHDIYKRVRSLNRKKVQHQYDEVRYEVIAGKENKGKHAKGRYGEVGNLVATLAHKKNASLYTKIKDDDKQRVVKKIQLKQHQFSSKGTTVEQVKSEVEQATNAGQLHIKPATIDNNQAYVTMRRAPGVLLSRLLDGQLNLEQKKSLTEALINTAYQILQQKKIVHKDLKPDNIFVDMETQPYTVTILDYGRSSTAEGFTGEHLAFGTPHYTAPELHVGLWGKEGFTIEIDKEVEPKLDSFALGRILAQVWGNKNHQKYSCSSNFKDKPKSADLVLALDQSVPDDIVELIEGLTEFRPDDRLSLEGAFTKSLANNVIRELELYCEKKQSSLYQFFHNDSLSKKKENLARNLIDELKKEKSLANMEGVINQVIEENLEIENTANKSYGLFTSSSLDRILNRALAELNSENQSQQDENFHHDGQEVDTSYIKYMPWMM